MRRLLPRPWSRGRPREVLVGDRLPHPQDACREGGSGGPCRIVVAATMRKTRGAAPAFGLWAKYRYQARGLGAFRAQGATFASHSASGGITIHCSSRERPISNPRKRTTGIRAEYSQPVLRIASAGTYRSAMKAHAACDRNHGCRTAMASQPASGTASINSIGPSE